MQDAIKTGLSNNTGIENILLETKLERASLFTRVFNPEYSKSSDELYQIKYKLEQNRISKEIKASYISWLYMHHRLNVLFEEKSFYGDLVKISELRYKVGETDMLEKTNAQARYAEVKSKYIQAQNNISIAENKLKQKIYLDGDLIPETEELTIYEILKPEKDKNDTLNTVLKYYQKKIEVQKAGRGSKAKIRAEIAQNQFINQQNKANLEIENLTIELGNYFNQIVHYKEHALQQANLIIKTASLKYEKEDIDYTEYLNSISTAFKIKLDYIETIRKYNETAIKLEYYVN